MKNITLSASEEKIDEIRRIAKNRNTSVNTLFRDWLDHFIATKTNEEVQNRVAAFRETLKTTSFKSTKKYTREEMNER